MIYDNPLDNQIFRMKFWAEHCEVRTYTNNSITTWLKLMEFYQSLTEVGGHLFIVEKSWWKSINIWHNWWNHDLLTNLMEGRQILLYLMEILHFLLWWKSIILFDKKWWTSILINFDGHPFILINSMENNRCQTVFEIYHIVISKNMNTEIHHVL